MKRGAIAILGVSALALVGCTPATHSLASRAYETCQRAYQELPGSLTVLAEHTGEDVTPATPCDNWIESQGAEEFARFWNDPAEYMPYVVLESKIEATRP